MGLGAAHHRLARHSPTAGYGAGQIPRRAEERLDPPYTESTEVFYLSWSEQQGHFRYPLAYPRLEARRARSGDGWLVAVINHATDGAPVQARRPWLRGAAVDIRERTAQGARVAPDAEQAFAPLDVRVYHYARNAR